MKVRRTLGLLLTLTLAAGAFSDCLSFKPVGDPTRFYVLTAQSNREPLGRVPVAAMFVLSAGLGRTWQVR